MKRFCLHDAEAAPNFDKPEVKIERDVELGEAFHTEVIALTDKELVVDLAAAKNFYEGAKSSLSFSQSGHR